jgi:hypothetical protein
MVEMVGQAVSPAPPALFLGSAWPQVHHAGIRAQPQFIGQVTSVVVPVLVNHDLSLSQSRSVHFGASAGLVFQPARMLSAESNCVFDNRSLVNTNTKGGFGRSVSPAHFRELHRFSGASSHTLVAVRWGNSLTTHDFPARRWLFICTPHSRCNHDYRRAGLTEFGLA